MLLAEVAQATQRLADAGVPSPRNDAEELAAFVHGVKRGELHSVKDADFDARYWEVIARREQREPLQHITGRAYFRYLELQVGPGVFVPRPETESVVGWAIDAVRAMDVVEPLHRRPVHRLRRHRARPRPGGPALPRARRRAVRGRPRGGPARTWRAPGSTCARATPWTPSRDLDGQVDLVISNPPYIPLTEWEYVAPEARDYDPELALFSGEDGLDLIRGIERTAHRLLRPGGVVVIEHADTQGGQVPWIFTEERGWADAADHPDLNNRPRFATARKATAVTTPQTSTPQYVYEEAR